MTDDKTNRHKKIFRLKAMKKLKVPEMINKGPNGPEMSNSFRLGFYSGWNSGWNKGVDEIRWYQNKLIKNMFKRKIKRYNLLKTKPHDKLSKEEIKEKESLEKLFKDEVK